MALIIFYISVLMFLNTAGQLLLKKATYYKRGWKNIYLISGYALFLITIGISFLLLKLIDLKYFTIIMSLNYISVLFASAYWFEEKLTLKKLTGVLIIITGIVIFISDLFYV